MIRLLLDFNHLAIRCLFTTKVNWEEIGFDFHKHLLLNSIVSSIKKFEPKEVIFAVDDYKNWRKIVYQEYKANRKLSRDASDFPWNSYFEYINNFIKELEYLPFKIIQVPYSEADDIIAVLSKQNSENIIVTSDADYIQLLQYPHNKLFDPIKKKFIEEENPLRFLKLKILKGDKGDNIPAVKERMGSKTALKILENNQLEHFLNDSKTKENYERNEKLISFNHIPVTIQKEILKKYTEYKFGEEENYLNWFIKHRLKELSGKLQEITPIFRNLREIHNKSLSL